MAEERKRCAEGEGEAREGKRSKRECRKEKREEKKKERREDVARNGLVTEWDLAETRYASVEPLRRVEPYRFTYSVYAKQRWFGKTVFSVFRTEFMKDIPDDYAGLFVNGEQADSRTIVRCRDTIEHSVHRHEPPVAGGPLRILAQTDDLVVVDKPSSIPVHPCGRFRHNSVMFILARDMGLVRLHSAHRLDRLTSGVLMMAKSTEAASKYMRQIQDGAAHKTYLARVVGRFPEGETRVDQPIVLVCPRLGTNRVGPDGKPARTVFQLLAYDQSSDTSLVKCLPETGRTHQIRVHLQWLGYPICNDPLYNPQLSQTRKKWLMDEPADDEVADAVVPPEPSAQQETPTDAPPPSQPQAAQATAVANSDAPHPSWYDPACSECRRGWRDPDPEDLVMWLHALEYEGPSWKFTSPFPSWATSIYHANVDPSPSSPSSS